MPDVALDWPLVFAVLGAIFAGVVKGASATGFPLIATPLLTAALGPRPAVLAISVPTLLLNTIQSVAAPSQWRAARQITTVFVGELIGLPLGVWLLVNLDQRLLSGVIGAAVLLFVVYTVRFPNAALPPGRASAAFGAAAGFAGGVMGGTTGFFGPPLTIYLFSLKLDREVFVFLISLTYQIISVAQVGLYLLAGLYTPASLLVGVGLCVPAYLGFRFGVAIRPRLDQRAFYWLILTVLTVSALNALRPLVFH